MIAVLTADIINSADFPAARWMEVLKNCLSRFGQSPQDWEIYRGDELQLRTSREEALKTAFEIKAEIKRIKGLDIRIAIGLGEEDYRGEGVAQSNGSAYLRSGRMLEKLKSQKKNLGIESGHKSFDRNLNLMFDLASDFMDGWSSVSAEMVVYALRYPELNQTEVADKLDIQQSAVSQRQKRARIGLMNDLLEHYNYALKELDL